MGPPRPVAAWWVEVVAVTLHLTTTRTRAARPERDETRSRRDRHQSLGRKIVGGFYLTMGGVHLGIVAADPQFYAPFADDSFVPVLQTAWNEIFMAAPALWGLVMCLAEVAIGVMLLVGGRWTMPGWSLVIAFHLMLVLMVGWGILVWVVPFLAVVVPLALADRRRTR